MEQSFWERSVKNTLNILTDLYLSKLWRIFAAIFKNT